MTRYTRHLGALLPAEPTIADTQALDAAVRGTLGFGPAVDCPEIWAAVKAHPDREAFDAEVRGRIPAGPKHPPDA